jgi:hypothetical protein
VGRALSGWRPYEAWANPAENVGVEYLLKHKALIHTGKREDGGGLFALEGIKRERDLLRESQKIVRLVGLSAVGKTRFMQALLPIYC